MCYSENFEEEEIDLHKNNEVAMVRNFLAQFGLSLDMTMEYVMALYQDDRIVATGALAGETLCNIAVDPVYQGKGLAAKVISNLIKEAGRRGRYCYYICTNPETEHLFSSLGFTKITQIDAHTVLLELGLNMKGASSNSQSYTNHWHTHTTSLGTGG